MELYVARVLGGISAAFIMGLVLRHMLRILHLIQNVPKAMGYLFAAY